VADERRELDRMFRALGLPSEKGEKLIAGLSDQLVVFGHDEGLLSFGADVAVAVAESRGRRLDWNAAKERLKERLWSEQAMRDPELLCLAAGDAVRELSEPGPELTVLAMDIRHRVPEVRFATSPLHDRVLDYLREHHGERLTYTDAYDRVALELAAERTGVKLVAGGHEEFTRKVDEYLSKHPGVTRKEAEKRVAEQEAKARAEVNGRRANLRRVIVTGA
jgi:hypothetical protein